jgi:hypothetical protein
MLGFVERTIYDSIQFAKRKSPHRYRRRRIACGGVSCSLRNPRPLAGAMEVIDIYPQMQSASCSASRRFRYLAALAIQLDRLRVLMVQTVLR